MIKHFFTAPFPAPIKAVVKVLSYWRPFFLKGAHQNLLNLQNLLSRVDGIRLLCPPLTEPYVRFSRIRLLE